MASKELSEPETEIELYIISMTYPWAGFQKPPLCSTFALNPVLVISYDRSHVVPYSSTYDLIASERKSVLTCPVQCLACIDSLTVVVASSRKGLSL